MSQFLYFCDQKKACCFSDKCAKYGGECKMTSDKNHATKGLECFIFYGGMHDGKERGK